MPREGQSQEKNIRHNPTLRGLGFLLLIIGISVLGWDFYRIMSGMPSYAGYFSSISDVLNYYNRNILFNLENSFAQYGLDSLWSLIVHPVISVPASPAFGIPGFILMRVYAPGITIRGATTEELKMQSLGMNPKHIHRHRRDEGNKQKKKTKQAPKQPNNEGDN